MKLLLLALLAYGSFYWCYLGFKGRFPLSDSRKVGGTAGKVLGFVFAIIGICLVAILFECIKMLQSA